MGKYAKSPGVPDSLETIAPRSLAVAPHRIYIVIPVIAAIWVDRWNSCIQPRIFRSDAFKGRLKKHIFLYV